MTTEAPTQELITRDAGLPEPVARRGINEAQWRTLANNLFPGAAPQSVLMVWDYCMARKLDPLKKPCHIVPMRVKDVKSGEWGWRDVVMPGIYEYRITAHRTGQYLGHSQPEYGPMVDHLGTKAPEWCAITIFRHSAHADGGRIEFPVRRYFAEVVGLTKDGKVNDRWSKAPIQMLEKCTEAAGLREAFPDEFGGEPTAEEMDDQRVPDVEPIIQSNPPQPAQRKSQTPAPSQAAPATRNEGQGHEPQAGAASDHGGNPTLAPSSTPKHIGLITKVDEQTNGTLITLATGFKAATRDAAVIRGAHAAEGAKMRVELVTKPPSSPKFAPIITELKPILSDLQDDPQS